MTEVRSFEANSHPAASRELQRLLWPQAYDALAAEDQLYKTVTRWLSQDAVSLKRAQRQAEKRDVPLCLMISRFSPEPQVYTPKPEAYTACPLGSQRYRGAVFVQQHFWLFRGVLYREGETGLCQFCVHQLRCAVEGEPLDAFKNAQPRPRQQKKA